MEISEILKDQFDESLEIKNTECFKGKVVLITGAAGSIGQKLAETLLFFDVEKLVLLDNNESDLYNLQQKMLLKNHTNFHVALVNIIEKEDVEHVFKRYTPNIVYHCAAYKHVPLLEDFPYQAFKTNVLGTNTVAEISLRYKVEQFIFISTDKAVMPKSIMGATKKLGEICLSRFIDSKTTKFKIVRFGNIPYSSGSILPLWDIQLKMQNKIEVVNQQFYRYFISINQVCQLLIEILNNNKASLFVAKMSEPVNMKSLAIAFLEQRGKKESYLKYMEARPGDKEFELLYDGLEKEKLLEDEICLIGELLKQEDKIKNVNQLIVNYKSLNLEHMKGRIMKIVE